MSVLSQFEFEMWLHRQGLSKEPRRRAVQDYIDVLDIVVPLSPEIAELAEDFRPST